MKKHFAHKTTLSIAAILALSSWLPSHSLGSTRSLGSQVHRLRESVLESAMLLEQFGEVERAYELVRIACPDDTALSASEREQAARLLMKLGLYERSDRLLTGGILPPRPDGRYRHTLQRARLNFLAGEYDKALELLGVLDTMTVSGMDDYRDFLSMEVHEMLGYSSEAADIGLRLNRKGVLASLTPGFEKTLLAVLMSAGRYPDALEIIDKAKGKFRNSNTVIPFLEEEIKIYFLLGDTAQAVQHAAQFIDRYAHTDEALETVRRLLETLAASELGDGELILCCRILLDHNKTDEAPSILAELEKRELDDDPAEKVRYYRMYLLYTEKRYMEALNRLNRPFKIKSLARNADLLAARCYRGLKQMLKAARSYEAFAKKYPYDGKAAEALTVAADLYERANYRTKSLEIKEHLVKTYPRSYYGQLSALQLSFYYTNKNRHENSIAILRAALARTTPKNESMLYYLSQSYEKAGRENRKNETLKILHSINANSFYFYPDIENTLFYPTITSRGKIALVGNSGLLSLLRAIAVKREEAYSLLSSHLKRNGNTESDWKSDPYLDRASFFLSAGFVDWAVCELEEFERRWRRDDLALIAAGKMYNDHSLAWNAVRVFGRLQYRLPKNNRQETKAAVERLMYPTPFPGLILENCAKNNLPPHLIFAIVREESRFEVKAVSRAGALGLMQLMPETGKSIAHNLDFPLHEDETLFTPEVNLSFGMWYASYLLERCDGNYHMMLTSYNAGLRNARRWFRKPTTKDDIRFVIDNIGYKETRRYVKKIVESATIYSKLYFYGGSHLPVSPGNNGFSR